MTDIEQKQSGGTLAQQDPNLLASLMQGENPYRYLKLCHPSAEVCQKGMMKGGQFCITGKEVTEAIPVGTYTSLKGEKQGRFRSIYLGFRPKATLMVNGKAELSSHDPRSPTFNRIRAAEKSSSVAPLIGPETLHYIPYDQFDLSIFAENGFSEEIQEKLKASVYNGAYALFHWSKSAKEYCCAALVRPGTYCDIVSNFVTRGEYTWPSPTETLRVDDAPEVNMDDHKSILNMFLNPDGPKVEVIDDNEQPSGPVR